MHQPATDPAPRVLHLTQPVDGGVARVVTDLTRAQLASGLHVAVACPDGPLATALRSLGADVRLWRATRSPGPWLGGEVRRLARIVDEVRPDLVHAHSAKAGLAGRLAVRGRIPTVFQPHAWSFEAVGGVTALLALGWERWAARWAARVVCVSEAERRRGVSAGIRGRWTVVPNGVDPGRFHPAGPVPAAVAARAAGPAPAADAIRAAGPASSAGPGGPTGPVRPTGPTGIAAPHPLLTDAGPRASLVVCVGRLCRQKGQDVLLTAWDRVAERVPGARLALVGDGPERSRLRSLAPASVTFAGAVTDAAPWYRAADVVVLPSRWEGMALAPLEAMACGRPVVLTDVDGAREVLPPALAPHCLVPPEDPAALADAVAALLRDPELRASTGRQGRAHVLSAHDLRHTAGAVAAVYGELLGRGPVTAGPPAVPTEHRESIHS